MGGLGLSCRTIVSPTFQELHIILTHQSFSLFLSLKKIKKRLERSGATAAEIKQFFENVEKKVKEEKAREKAAERMATVEEERLEEMDAVKEAKSEDGKATEEAEAR